MTLGENIWAQAILKTDCIVLEEPARSALVELGKLIIAAIDANFADLKRDHQAEVASLEAYYIDNSR